MTEWIHIVGFVNDKPVICYSTNDVEPPGECPVCGTVMNAGCGSTVWMTTHNLVDPLVRLANGPWGDVYAN